MDDTTIARTIHVLAVVLWIGGLAFVTSVLLPSLRRIPVDRLVFFDIAERRFAKQARITTLLAGLTGLYMVIHLDLWDRFLFARFWWMHAMVIVWLLFTLMLFVVEPLFSGSRLHARVTAERESTFRTISLLHWLLLILSLITVVGAVAGSHGVLFFK
jgi:uncharacterized membrane protein